MKFHNKKNHNNQKYKAIISIIPKKLYKGKSICTNNFIKVYKKIPSKHFNNVSNKQKKKN